MEYLETISKMVVAGIAVWRLTRSVYVAYDDGGLSGMGHPALPRIQPEELLGTRLTDFLSWLGASVGVWMSAQTAIWVVCGFGGVLVNWLVFAGAMRLLRKTRIHVAQQVEKAGPPQAVVSGKSAIARSAFATEASKGAIELCL